MKAPHIYSHPSLTRRTMLPAGSICLSGLGMNHLAGLREASAAGGSGRPSGKAKSCIYIFLSGGLAQHDSFDMKPDAPDTVRGEFNPIATKTPSIQICEDLPQLAQRSQKWSLVRSLTHWSNEHSEGHQIMLSGRTPMPPNFKANKPQRSDWPSMAAIANAATMRRNNLPPAAVLPERLIHSSGRIIPG